MASWKRDAASGIIVLAPILVTLWVVYWLFSRIASVPLLERSIADPYLRVLVTVVVLALLVLAIGYLMRTALGDFVEEVIDDLMNRLPGLRVVYNASKMGVETAVSGTSELQKPVKLETWRGIRMTAFKTGRTAPDGREVLFIPTAPNITTGFVVEVDPDRLIETDETVEEALTRVLSAGFGERDDGVPIAVTEEGEAGRATEADGSDES